MGRALKLYQILSTFPGLARASSLRVSERSQAEVPAADSEKVIPWASRPSEEPLDFVRTIIFGGAAPAPRNGTVQNLSMTVPGGAEDAQKRPKTAMLLVGLMRGWELNLDAMLSGMVRPNSAHILYSH